MIGGVATRLLVGSATALSFWFGNPSIAMEEFPTRLPLCPSTSNCVSSNPLEPPNRYISPLTSLQEDADSVFRRVVRDWGSQARGAVLVESLPQQRYLHGTLPGTASGSLDDVELLVVPADESTLVQLRCEARVTLPPPPFCLKKNCINGNMDQRLRLDGIGRALGLPAADQQRMQESAKWTPIFFNSDRVPGFEDDWE